VGQPIAVSLPSRVEVELGCDNITGERKILLLLKNWHGEGGGGGKLRSQIHFNHFKASPPPQVPLPPPPQWPRLLSRCLGTWYCLLLQQGRLQKIRIQSGSGSVPFSGLKSFTDSAMDETHLVTHQFV
jgi:hypothetical protein